MGVKDVQFISDKQWLAGIRDIIELHKYGRADEVRTVHRLASTCEERYQKALEYLEGKRGQQGKPAGAREGRREDSRGNLLAQGKEGGQQGKPAGAREGRRTAGGTCWSKQGGRKERGRQGEPAGAREGRRKERGRQGEPAGASGGKERRQQGEPAGAREGERTAGKTCWRKGGGGRREDGRGNLLEQARGEEGERTAGETCWSKQGGRKEGGRQGNLVFTTFGSAEGGHARKYSNKFGISLTYP